jgi:hypothetical protein
VQASAISPAIRPEAARGPAATRSAVTNGKRLHVEPPGDTRWARRFADVLAGILADVSAGAPEALSEGQRQLARRAATIAIACEKMEGEAAAGATFDAGLYGELTDRLGRTLNRLRSDACLEERR